MVVGKSGERALSRVLLRNVESGAWRVERDREFASLRRWNRGKRYEVRGKTNRESSRRSLRSGEDENLFVIL